MATIEEKRDEFDRHVWDHAADAFQMQFDERRELSPEEDHFLKLLHSLVVDPDDAIVLGQLREILSRDEEKLGLLLQICGLTRNKILTDLRASAATKAQGIKVPSSYRRIADKSVWPVSGPYLLHRLRSVLGTTGPDDATSEAMYEALNQATWPGFIRQERAKRSGHEAEYRLATLLASLKIPFEPKEKADNPLCRDAQIGEVSFDLVVPTIADPSVVIKSTVHTANIGQYGESKDHLEIDEARRFLDAGYPDQSRPTLLAFVDGVGFRSNRAGLAGVLSKSDEFCQFSTVWKAVLITAKRSGIQVRIALTADQIEEFSEFIDRWDARDMIDDVATLESLVGWIDAGTAKAYRIESPD